MKLWTKRSRKCFISSWIYSPNCVASADFSSSFTLNNVVIDNSYQFRRSNKKKLNIKARIEEEHFNDIWSRKNEIESNCENKRQIKETTIFIKRSFDRFIFYGNSFEINWRKSFQWYFFISWKNRKWRCKCFFVLRILSRAMCFSIFVSLSDACLPVRSVA